MTMNKAKPYLVTGGIALGAILLLNTLANRNATVAKVRNTINTGL